MPFIFNMFLSPRFAYGTTYRVATIEVIMGWCVPQGPAKETRHQQLIPEHQPLHRVEPHKIEETDTLPRFDKDWHDFIFPPWDGLASVTICGRSGCLAHHHGILTLPLIKYCISQWEECSSGLISMEFVLAHFSPGRFNALVELPSECTYNNRWGTEC